MMRKEMIKMGKTQKRKGKRVEYLIRDKLINSGFEARRVVLSGATTMEKGDIVVEQNGKRITLEVKARKHGFQQILMQIATNRACYFEFDDTYICFDWSTFLNILNGQPLPMPKDRIRGYKQLTDWYKDNIDFLVVKIDYFEPFVVKKIRRG